MLEKNRCILYFLSSQCLPVAESVGRSDIQTSPSTTNEERYLS